MTNKEINEGMQELVSTLEDISMNLESIHNQLGILNNNLAYPPRKV